VNHAAREYADNVNVNVNLGEMKHFHIDIKQLFSWVAFLPLISL
jgi:hypothetical protein